MMNLSFIIKISEIATPSVIISSIMDFIISLGHCIIEIAIIIYAFSVTSILAKN